MVHRFVRWEKGTKLQCVKLNELFRYRCGRVSIVPIDFFVDALHRISQQECVGGKCLHLVELNALCNERVRQDEHQLNEHQHETDAHADT